MNFSINKSFRLLNMYERLNKGEVIQKSKLAEEFSVSKKTVERDIEELRIYISEVHYTEHEATIKYSREKRGYYLVLFQREWITNEEVLALCKIILESRAFCKDEMNKIINKLIAQVVPSSRKKIEQMIRNEQYYYVPLKHEKPLFSILWELTQAITESRIIEFNYKRQDDSYKVHFVKPVAVMFSEYYFYLIAYKNNENNDYPIIFRVDRIDNLRNTTNHFTIPYKEKFNEGEFRKRIQFMYSGELKRVTFDFNGPSLEAVLDRIPTAKVISKDGDVYKISAEVYGDGIQMWIRSQGEWVNNVNI